MQITARTRRINGSDISVIEETVEWDGTKTALILCDMWDKHWCDGAADRVAELAPVMDEAVNAARNQGVLVIHSPSDTMAFYEGTPQRRRATEAPDAKFPEQTPPYHHPNEPPLPIDDSDGGCDSGQEGYRAWSRQHPLITIAPEDAISDSGREVYNLLHQEGRDRVLLMGVHTNMCILGRSFAIRSLRGLNIPVMLVRDMTDAMYNPARPPYVNHFEGTRRGIAHIETYLCPTIESANITGSAPFRYQDDR